MKLGRWIFLALLTWLPQLAIAELPFSFTTNTGISIPYTIQQHHIYLNEYRYGAGLRVIFKHTPSQCLLGGLPCTKSYQAPYQQLSLRFMLNGKSQRFTIHRLPPSFPEFRITGKSGLPYPLIFSANAVENQLPPDCHLLVVSPKGELQFYRRLEHVCFDFRPHDINGKRYYSYQKVLESSSVIGTFGPMVILDENFQFVKIIETNFSGHEFLLLSLNHWIGLEAQISRLQNGMAYLEKRIREYRDGKVVFDWGGSDFFKQTKSEATLQTNYGEYKGELVADVLHLNSVQLLPSGDLFVGLGFNGVAYISRKEQKAMWILGGLADQFSLSIEDQPYLQHAAQYDWVSQSVVLYANYYPFILRHNQARILRYELDVAKKQNNRTVLLHRGDEIALTMGSVQLLDDTINFGIGFHNSPKAFDFMELKRGQSQFSLKFAKFQKHKVYRFYRRPYGVP